MSRIRYPGSKLKYAPAILKLLPSELWMAFTTTKLTYVEPFFGSGAIGWEVMSRLYDGPKIVINDKDRGLMCLWRSVKNNPLELIERIKVASPDLELFDQLMAQDRDENLGDIEAGVAKLLIHQMSFSGLGAMSGGPIGGRNQEDADYKIDCRWNPSAQSDYVMDRSDLLNRFDAEILNEDYSTVLERYDSDDTIFYVDPPYFGKGRVLYKHSFEDQNHVNLSNQLSTIGGKFILSYDDCPEIRRLYQWCDIVELPVRYSICTSRTRSELLIKNF